MLETTVDVHLPIPEFKTATFTKRKRRTCTQKVAFRSELAAMRVGARYGQDWYRCPYCHAWHLTSKNSQPGERHG